MSERKPPTIEKFFPLLIQEHGIEAVMDQMTKELERRAKVAAHQEFTLAARRYMQAQQFVELAKMATCIGIATPEKTPAVPPVDCSMLMEGMRPKQVAKFFSRAPRDWADHWWGLKSARDGFIYALGQAAQEIPESPTWTRDRGVCIAAGGWKYFPSLYVTVRMIRHHECKLPIEVWYFGDKNELHPKMVEILEPYDIWWVDANKTWRDHPESRVRWPMINHGWWLKAYMMAYADFKEIILFDADAYPTRDPETILAEPDYLETGAIFWPDLMHFRPEQWKHFGLDPRPGMAFESGQIVVDKSKTWPQVWLSHWMNAHWDYVYKHIHGDKDTFLIAWHTTEKRYSQPQPDCEYHGSCILQFDFQGDVWTVHRAQDKFRLERDHEGMKIENKYYGPNTCKAPYVDRYLPWEWQAHEYFKQLKSIMEAR